MNIKKKEKRKSWQKEKGFSDWFSFVSQSYLPDRIARLLQTKRATLSRNGVFYLPGIEKASRKTVAVSGNSYYTLGITTDRLSKGSARIVIRVARPFNKPTVLCGKDSKV